MLQKTQKNKKYSDFDENIPTSSIQKKILPGVKNLFLEVFKCFFFLEFLLKPPQNAKIAKFLNSFVSFVLGTRFRLGGLPREHRLGITGSCRAEAISRMPTSLRARMHVDIRNGTRNSVRTASFLGRAWSANRNRDCQLCKKRF